MLMIPNIKNKLSFKYKRQKSSNTPQDSFVTSPFFSLLNSKLTLPFWLHIYMRGSSVLNHRFALSSDSLALHFFFLPLHLMLVSRATILLWTVEGDNAAFEWMESSVKQHKEKKE